MTRAEVEARATELKRKLDADGIWDKLDTFFRVDGEFVLVKEGNEIVVHEGKKWPPQ